jgi:hypothetical protein
MVDYMKLFLNYDIKVSKMMVMRVIDIISVRINLFNKKLIENNLQQP